MRVAVTAATQSRYFGMYFITDKEHTTFSYVAPVLTVIGFVNPMNGTGTAGKLFLITCIVTGADNLDARFNFSLIAGGNNSVIHRDEDTRETQFIHTFTAKASDEGIYTCKVTVSSSFLDEAITSNITMTLTLQSKTKLCQRNALSHQFYIAHT